MSKLYVAFYKLKDFGVVWSYDYCKILFRVKFDHINECEVGVVMKPDVGVDMSVRSLSTDQCMQHINFSDKYYVFIIEMSNNELRQIFHMCTTMKQMRVSYDASYLLRSYVFAVPDNAADVQTIQALHNAQFVVVVLRECMAASHPMTVFFKSLNSTTVTPTSLFRKLMQWNDSPSNVYNAETDTCVLSFRPIDNLVTFEQFDGFIYEELFTTD